jgi:hypothetical protein
MDGRAAHGLLWSIFTEELDGWDLELFPEGIPNQRSSNLSFMTEKSATVAKEPVQLNHCEGCWLSRDARKLFKRPCWPETLQDFRSLLQVMLCPLPYRVRSALYMGKVVGSGR